MKHIIAPIVFATLIAATVVADEPTTARELVTRGMKLLADGDVAGSLADFDKAAEVDANVAPHLWQRGLALYYAGRFAEGAKQFESHKTVNPNDVENAAWHLICVVKAQGLEAARKKLIEIDTARDTRAPMKQIYECYAGRATADDVLAAAEKADTDEARMYAHLYMGLYAEATGDAEAAKSHLLKSAAANADGNYMHAIAKMHVKLRGWDKP